MLDQKFRFCFGWTPAFCAVKEVTGMRNQVPNLPGIPCSCQFPYLLGMVWAKAGIWLLADIYQLAYQRT